MKAILKYNVLKQDDNKPVETVWKQKFGISAGLFTVLKLSGKLRKNGEICRSIDSVTEGDVLTADVTEEEAAQTDPDQAKLFVEETGIDALAVAIGTVHGVYNFPPRINIERLKKIAEKVSIPLVLHGGSGTPDEKVQEAIANGIAKINICTEFVTAFGKQYIASQNEEGFKYSTSSLFTPAKLAGKAVAASKIKLFSLK